MEKLKTFSILFCVICSNLNLSMIDNNNHINMDDHCISCHRHYCEWPIFLLASINHKVMTTTNIRQR
ncbi:hypothetical protein DERF_014218 [Dermatophagoides farinae]|uniref:Uncharacterized protein n=1 Tax=Dermatophagoides farinae TaxID=6954 RepID=A0A922HH38_DERFA|nr:hypothetical protein DERF_014218 [Dermatophagoides farinae]